MKLGRIVGKHDSLQVEAYAVDCIYVYGGVGGKYKCTIALAATEISCQCKI